MLFPFTKREFLKLSPKEQTQAAAETVTIKNFDLWTPTKSEHLLDNTTLTLETGKRCALYGINGSGKTMLFHALAHGQVAGFPTHVSAPYAGDEHGPGRRCRQRHGHRDLLAPYAPCAGL